jgi:hypothetical protein
MLQPVIPITRRSQLVYARQHGMGDLTDSIKSFVSSGAGGAVRRVTIRSNLSPDISLDPREAAGPGGMVAAGKDAPPVAGVRRRGGFSEAIMAFAKPEIEVETPIGVVRVAPWGQPTTNLFWPVVIIGAAGITALGILAYRGLKA